MHNQTKKREYSRGLHKQASSDNSYDKSRTQQRNQCCQVCSGQRQIPRIKIRASRLLREIRHLDHETRLAPLTTLVERWKRANAILMYKLNTHMNEVRWIKPFTFNHQTARTGPSGSTRQIDWITRDPSSINQ